MPFAHTASRAKIRHRHIHSYDNRGYGSDLCHRMSFLTHFTRLEHLTLTANPRHSEIVILSWACTSLNDLRLHLDGQDKPFDAAIFPALAGVYTELGFKQPVSGTDWFALSAVGSSLRKLVVEIAGNSLVSIRDFLLHTDVLEELSLRHMNEYNQPEIGTLSASTCNALASGVEHAWQLSHLELYLRDYNHSFVPASPTVCTDGVVSVMRALGDSVRRFVVRISFDGCADNAMYSSMLTVMRAAPECMPFVKTFEVDMHQTEVQDGECLPRTCGRREMAQILRDVIDVAEKFESRLRGVETVRCSIGDEYIAKKAQEEFQKILDKSELYLLTEVP